MRCGSFKQRAYNWPVKLAPIELGIHPKLRLAMSRLQKRERVGKSKTSLTLWYEREPRLPKEALLPLLEWQAPLARARMLLQPKSGDPFPFGPSYAR